VVASIQSDVIRYNEGGKPRSILGSEDRKLMQNRHHQAVRPRQLDAWKSASLAFTN